MAGYEAGKRTILQVLLVIWPRLELVVAEKSLFNLGKAVRFLLELLFSCHSSCAIHVVLLETKLQQRDMAVNATHRLFEDFLLADGRMSCACIVSDECRKRKVSYLRRGDLAEHMKGVHGIQCDIPRRTSGRPRGQRMGPSRPEYEKQSRARFLDIEYKYKRNLKAQAERVAKRAAKAWDVLSEEDKDLAGTKEHYIQIKVEQEMETYELDKETRIGRIKNRIEKGFERNRRPRTKKATTDASHASIDAEMTPVNCLALGKQGLQNAPTKPRSKRHFLEQNSQSKSSPKIRFLLRDQSSPILVNDSPMLVSSHPLSLEIANKSIHAGPGASTSDENTLIKERFSSGGTIQYVSQRFSLVVDISKDVIGSFTKGKASSQAMNIFYMWLENTLEKESLTSVWFIDSLWYNYFDSSKCLDSQKMQNYFDPVDVSKHLFTFVPIVHRDHWVLFVLYNNCKKRLTRLPSRTHGLLYFNSLKSPYPEFYLETVYRALAIMSSACTEESMKCFLSTPRTKLEANEHPKVPQQPNVHDCGYYVMAYIKCLVEQAHGARSKSWLTTTWFKHHFVEELKEDLAKWTNKCITDL